jgi:L-cysteine S-thiosulfotransferase
MTRLPVEAWMRRRLSIITAVIAAALALPALAIDDTEKQLEKYRQMLKDDPWSNPGLLDADRGEALWKQVRGPKNVSLEQCDLGKGPGKVDGAFAELPRYFKDADRVMDLESRLVWCIEKLQGFSHAEIVKRPYSKANQTGTDLEALATYVTFKSNGSKFAPSLTHAKEKEVLALGEALFFRRQGPMDFACATCHGDSGKRIRLQSLPYLTKPEEARTVIGEWPAYRVSQGTVMTTQHRIADCFWQMRLPLVDYGSDVTIALTMFLVNQAKGGDITAPAIKR